MFRISHSGALPKQIKNRAEPCWELFLVAQAKLFIIVFSKRVAFLKPSSATRYRKGRLNFPRIWLVDHTKSLFTNLVEVYPECVHTPEPIAAICVCI